MKRIFAIMLLMGIYLSACQTPSDQETSNNSVDNVLLTDSLATQNIDSLPGIGNSNFLQRLATQRRSRLSAALQLEGIKAREIPGIVDEIQDKYLELDDMDILEVGENASSVVTNQGKASLISLVFGPYDGNGRGYSVLAIDGENVYISEQKWGLEAIDSVYNIQMANKKKIIFGTNEALVQSDSSGTLKLFKVNK